MLIASVPNTSTHPSVMIARLESAFCLSRSEREAYGFKCTSSQEQFSELPPEALSGLRARPQSRKVGHSHSATTSSRRFIDRASSMRRSRSSFFFSASARQRTPGGSLRAKPPTSFQISAMLTPDRFDRSMKRSWSRMLSS